MTKNLKRLLTITFCALIHTGTASAQTAAPVTLQIDVENSVQYFEDTADLTKFATISGPTPPIPAKNFGHAFEVDDIVAVNGQPAKGTVLRCR